MASARISNIVERDFFGALLGTFPAVLLARLLLLVTELNPWFLMGLLGISAWTGAFLAHYSARSGDPALTALRARTPQLRAICLRVMLWLLGAAAVIGVLTVLTASYDILGRVAGTTIATAIAAGFLWPVTILIERPKSQAAGLLGMAAVIVVYALVIPLIWDWGYSDDDIVWTSLVITLTTPAGMCFLRLLHVPAALIAARAGMVLYATVTGMLLVAIWYPARRAVSGDLVETGLWLAAFGGLAVVCLAGLVPSTLPDWRWLGVLASGVAWVLVSMGVWNRHHPFADEKVITLFSTIAVVVAHTNLTLFVPLLPGQLWVRIGTTIAVITAGVFLDLELLFSSSHQIGLLGRIAGAAGVVASCGSLALMVLARLNRGIDLAGESRELTEIALTCPRCHKKQTVSLGEAQCARCGLGIRVAIAGVERLPG